MSFFKRIIDLSLTTLLSVIYLGKSLIYALTPDVRKEFLSIALKCKSVICCRVSPAQKAEIVEMVKNSTRMVRDFSKLLILFE